MNRTWSVCRQPSPNRDGERRWDQAYQLLVRWAGHGGGLPGLTLIAEEDADARRRCMRGCRLPARPRRWVSRSSLTGCARRPRSAAGSWMTGTSTAMTAIAAPAWAGRGWTGAA